jgi:hypothetical protein
MRNIFKKEKREQLSDWLEQKEPCDPFINEIIKFSEKNCLSTATKDKIVDYLIERDKIRNQFVYKVKLSDAEAMREFEKRFKKDLGLINTN